MNIDWQNATVGALVILAVGYIAYRGWLVVVRKKSSGCGSGCSSCDEKPVGGETRRPFVPIDNLTNSRKDS